jgi:tellurite resistance protein TerC
MTTLWIATILFILVLLYIDLGLFRKKAHVLAFQEALLGCVLWIGISLAFNGFIYYQFGPDTALEFLTGYLIEYSLSVDNLFVFMLAFSYFNVPAQYQQRVLFFGILGAIIMRGAFIALGTAILSTFHWIIYLFGILLIISGIKLFFQKDETIEPENNAVVRAFKRFVPLLTEYRGQNFVVFEQGRWMATPLLLVLISVEVSDLIFAVDSIPAIFGITRDPYIVFTSNIFAVLGLRSLYFLLSTSMNNLALLRHGLALILVFVGLKMVFEDIVKISNATSLAIIVSILIGAVVGSLLIRNKTEETP